jgi:hypothetical protein
LSVVLVGFVEYIFNEEERKKRQWILKN